MSETRCESKEYFETKDKGSDDICTSDMIEAAPQYTANILLVWEKKTVHAGGRWRVVRMKIRSGGNGRIGRIGRVGRRLPSGGSSGKEELEPL